MPEGVPGPALLLNGGGLRQKNFKYISFSFQSFTPDFKHLRIADLKNKILNIFLCISLVQTKNPLGSWLELAR